MDKLFWNSNRLIYRRKGASRQIGTRTVNGRLYLVRTERNQFIRKFQGWGVTCKLVRSYRQLGLKRWAMFYGLDATGDVYTGWVDLKLLRSRRPFKLGGFESQLLIKPEDIKREKE